MKFAPPPLPLLFFVLFSVTAQICLKACGEYAVSIKNTYAAWLFNPYLYLALLCYGCSVPFWLRTLKKLPLSSAYPWTALIYLLTPAAAVLIWQERLSANYFAGMACILCGILITVNARVR